MSYMGIDYGSKRIGIAFSDEGHTVAFPHSVLPNDGKLFEEMRKLCEEKGVTAIIMGESKDFHGKDNWIMKEIFSFKEMLEKSLGLPVFLEPEFLTSAQADRQTRPAKPHGRARGREEKRQKSESGLDASAAALILQSYLDKKINTTRITN